MNKTIITGFLFSLFCSCATVNKQPENPLLLYNSEKVIDFLHRQDIKAENIELVAVVPLVYKICWIASSEKPKVYYAIDFKGKIIANANPFEHHRLGEVFMIGNYKFRQIIKDGVIHITLA